MVRYKIHCLSDFMFVSFVNELIKYSNAFIAVKSVFIVICLTRELIKFYRIQHVSIPACINVRFTGVQSYRMYVMCCRELV